MNDFFEQMQSEELSNIMNYLEYLEANNLTLDENGNEVPKDEDDKLTLDNSNNYWR